MFSPLKARICEVRVSRVARVGVEGGWRPSLSWPVVFIFVFVFLFYVFFINIYLTFVFNFRF